MTCRHTHGTLLLQTELKLANFGSYYGNTVLTESSSHVLRWSVISLLEEKLFKTSLKHLKHSSVYLSYCGTLSVNVWIGIICITVYVI